MSYTEDELWGLLQRAEQMPYGPGQVALVEQIIDHADAQSMADLAFAARMQATTSHNYAGEPARSVVTFAWCLAEFDRDPERYRRHEYYLLWHFKYMVHALTRFPDVELDRTNAVLDDMERRWRDTGHSPHAVYANRHFLARHLGDFVAAQHWYLQWCAARRDELSDCVGCDPTAKVYWLSLKGRDEEAIAVATPVLAGRLTCSEQPQAMLTALLVPYLRTGRLTEARDAHRRAYQLFMPQRANLEDIAEHVAFCARTGNEARAVEIVQRHLSWLDRAPSPWAAMMFAAAAAHALDRAQALSSTELQVASDTSATDLAERLSAQAAEIAAQFDRRNGTDQVGGEVREMLTAAPLVDRLPLASSIASSIVGFFRKA